MEEWDTEDKDLKLLLNSKFIICVGMCSKSRIAYMWILIFLSLVEHNSYFTKLLSFAAKNN